MGMRSAILQWLGREEQIQLQGRPVSRETWVMSSVLVNLQLRDIERQRAGNTVTANCDQSHVGPLVRSEWKVIDNFRKSRKLSYHEVEILFRSPRFFRQYLRTATLEDRRRFLANLTDQAYSDLTKDVPAVKVDDPRTDGIIEYLTVVAFGSTIDSSNDAVGVIIASELGVIHRFRDDRNLSDEEIDHLFMSSFVPRYLDVLLPQKASFLRAISESQLRLYLEEGRENNRRKPAHFVQGSIEHYLFHVARTKSKDGEATWSAAQPGASSGRKPR